jgi:hypothetical protein
MASCYHTFKVQRVGLIAPLTQVGEFWSWKLCWGSRLQPVGSEEADYNAERGEKGRSI